MKKNLFTILCLIQLSSFSFAQDMDEELIETSKTQVSLNITETNYNIQLSYETYTPFDRNEYSYQGINIDLQRIISIDDSQLVLLMGPNMSVLGDKYNSEQEDVVFIKWDQGIAYNIDMGDDMLLQPVLVLGIGYGWIDRDDSQQSPIAEIQAGLNLIPNNTTNFYAKAGYRLFDLDDSGSRSLGDLKGGFGMAGFGKMF